VLLCAPRQRSWYQRVGVTGCVIVGMQHIVCLAVVLVGFGVMSAVACTAVLLS
jgi:hypothetical protein